MEEGRFRKIQEKKRGMGRKGETSSKVTIMKRRY
jgi:hypothetical protein